MPARCMPTSSRPRDAALPERLGGRRGARRRSQGAHAHELRGAGEIERRPLLLVRAKAGEKEVGLVLQNAETIRLTAPDGSPASVASLKPGDKILAYLSAGARHFGMKVEETIKERWQRFGLVLSSRR